MVFGAFETSLRGGDSPSVDRKMLHKGCSGHLHGHGVKKERSLRDIPAVARHVCHPLGPHDTSSSDESDLHMIAAKRAAMQVQSRSQSSDCHLNSGSSPPGAHTVAKRSSSAVVAQRLYSSPTKSTTAKVRAERAMSDGRKMTAEMKRLTERASLLSASMSASGGAGASSSTSNLLLNGKKPRWKSLAGEEHDPDSGHFSSSDTEGPAAARMNFVRSIMTPTPEERKQNVIHGVSDDEFSIIELRKRQRKERRDYVQGRSPKGGSGAGGRDSPGSRKESPSPSPKKRYAQGERGRRSSDELSSTSASPPTTPTPRSASSRPSSSEGFHFGGRRTASSGAATPSSGGRGGGGRGMNYAFGSSVKRFPSSKKINLDLSPPHYMFGKDKSFSRHRSAPFHSKGNSSDAEYHQHPRNLSLGRTTSDPSRQHKSAGSVASSSRSGGGHGSAKERQRDVVTKAWLQFKDDIENAMLKKPGSQSGLYKNLSDMMHTKMEMLNDESEVGMTVGS